MMKLEFKPDFERSRQNWDAFWKGENKQPLIIVTAPKEGVKPAAYPPYLAGSDGNFEPVIDQILAWGESHHFLGDAIPYYWMEFGPDTFASYLGADLKFYEEQRNTTSWSVPFVKDWDDIEIKFRRDSYWWQMTEAFIKAIRARCDGKLMIAPPTLVANLDALAAVRGIENLLADLAECPDKVRRALSQVCDAHTEVMRAYAVLLDFDTCGCINLDGNYISGSIGRPQCDMSCMISPDMFKEFVIPALEREASDTDAFRYHLDGPDALKHLDALLEAEFVDIVGFGAGAKGEGQDFTWVDEKSAAKGKKVVKYIYDHNELKRVCADPPTRGMIFYTSASSKTEGEALIADVERIWEA